MQNKSLFQIFIILLLTSFLYGTACSPKSNSIANPASEFCEENGGKVEIRDGDDGQYGVCVFPDGSECDEWAYARGQCKPASADDQSGMANPASVFCEQQGGIVEIRNTETGQVGYCIFDDGTECEEWAFFRGECNHENVKTLPPTEPEGDVITGSVYLTKAEILIAESFPVQIFLQITGEMPTPCDQLQVIVNAPDTDNQIVIELKSWQENNGIACAQVMTPFISKVNIDTQDFSDGTYTIWLDGKQIGTFNYPG